MEIKATQKFLIMSPRKLRVVANMVKKLTPNQAVLTLPFVGKAAAQPLSKVIKSAIANAKEKGVSEGELVFKEIQIGEGPRLKRGRPISRGQWHPVKRRMSHIRVVLETKTTSEELKVKNEKLQLKDQKTKDKK